jgi:hypothetical protein
VFADLAAAHDVVFRLVPAGLCEDPTHFAEAQHTGNEVTLRTAQHSTAQRSTASHSIVSKQEANTQQGQVDTVTMVHCGPSWHAH